MAAPWHLIEEKLEVAMQTALVTEYGGSIDSSGLITGGDFDGVRILIGFSLDEIEPPYIAVIADESEPAEDSLSIPTGNQSVQVKVRVCGHRGDTTRDLHSALAAKVKDFIYADALPNLLNAAGVTDLTVYRTYPSRTSRRIEDAMLITETTFTAKAMPS